MIIYKITNLLNGKSYIGQTTKTLEWRWREHCSDRSRCTAIHSAILKYGKENFKVEQIDVAVDLDELNSKEKLYIEYYNTLSPNGYNLTSGGDRYEMTDECRQRMRDYWATHDRTDAQREWANQLPNYRRGKPLNEEHKRKLGKAHEIKVIQYDINGRRIAVWDSLKDAADTLHIPRGNICRVCKGQRQTAGGYRWAYLENGGENKIAI